MSASIRRFINSIPSNRTALELQKALDLMLPTGKDTAVVAGSTQTQAGATALRTDCSYHNVITVATEGDGVALPLPKIGDFHFVKNSAAANAMKVYAATPGTIDSVATATGVTQLAGDAVLYFCQVDGDYLRFSGLGGVIATAAELNRVADVSTRIVSTTAATLAVTLAAHDSKTVVLASTHTQTLTLPAATGSGAKFMFAVSTTGTDGSKVIKVANTADVMAGASIVNSTSTAEASSFLTSATSDTITLNNTTTGGIAGTTVEITDIAASTFLVRVEASSSGTVATPFSATV